MAERTEEPESPIVNIVGEKVALGPHRRELIPLYQRWINDFVVVRNLGAFPPGPMTLDAETAWFDAVSKPSGREIGFTIYEREGWQPIGTTALHDIDYRNRTAEFGILIGEVSARGRGLGTEVTRLMLDYAFTALGLHNLMLRVYSFNLGAQRAYQKAGFRECGRRREAMMMGGRSYDVIFMDCLATEFTGSILRATFAPDQPRPDRH